MIEKTKEYGHSLSYNGYSKYSMGPKRPRNVVITIHGLWGNAEQFGSTIENTKAIGKINETNRIELTLPGHLKTTNDESYLTAVKKNPPFASFDKWLTALDETLKIAKMMGDDVTIVGQSTGGLLATIAAYKYPTHVKNLVLVEPALKVKSLLTFGSCNLGAALTKSPVVKALAKLVHSVPDGVNIKMGCEVQRLANHILSPLIDPAQPKEAKYSSAIQNLARQIKQPIYMINNERDGVVSAEINRVFFNSLQGVKLYDSINVDGKTPHGYVTSTDSSSLALAVLEIDYFTNPADKEAKRTYASVLQDLLGINIRNIWPRDSIHALKAFKFDRRLCQFVTKNDCEQVKEGVQSLIAILTQSVKTKTAPAPHLIEALKTKLRPACDELDRIAKPDYEAPWYKPSCG